MADRKPIAIVSHDAGGAEILCNWAARQSEPCLLVLDGPAKTIFERKQGQIEISTLENAIDKAGWVLTGTGWQSDLEVQAIRLAGKMGKRSVSFLDHWVNYRQRFEHNGELILPDEIWVGDDDALKMARDVFPGKNITLVPNPYFADIKSQIDDLGRSQSTDSTDVYVLYVCSPLREHALRDYGDERYWGFTEEDAVRYFMKNLHVLNHSTGKVILRPHPSEESGKYSWAIDEFAPNVSIGGDKDLLVEIAGSDVVAGYNSMAMVTGLIAGKRIINALPPGKLVNDLPMAEIKQMSDLLAEQPS